MPFPWQGEPCQSYGSANNFPRWCEYPSAPKNDPFPMNKGKKRMVSGWLLCDLPRRHLIITVEQKSSRNQKCKKMVWINSDTFFYADVISRIQVWYWSRGQWMSLLTQHVLWTHASKKDLLCKTSRHLSFASAHPIERELICDPHCTCHVSYLCKPVLLV